jgi:hypothetical protein
MSNMVGTSHFLRIPQRRSTATTHGFRQGRNQQQRLQRLQAFGLKTHGNANDFPYSSTPKRRRSETAATDKALRVENPLDKQAGNLRYKERAAVTT